MGSASYKLLFSGQIQEGFDQNQVRENLGKMLKMDGTGLDQLFSGRLITLKKGLDQSSAGKYQKALENAGARILIQLDQQTATAAPIAEEAQAQPVAGNEPEVAVAATKPAPVAAGEGEIQCPRCHHVQGRTEECSHCKMDLRRHIMRIERKAKQREARLKAANG